MHLYLFVSHKTESRLSNIQISVADVEGIINYLAIGHDQISHKLLESTMYSISKPLCKLFNKSQENYCFPNKWKQSVVIPLYKKGDKSSVNNYRPVSLLSCIGKLMERCVHKYIYKYLNLNGLIYKKQSGFLKGHSTSHSLLNY